jgi:hypothetical protein
MPSGVRVVQAGEALKQTGLVSVRGKQFAHSDQHAAPFAPSDQSGHRSTLEHLQRSTAQRGGDLIESPSVKAIDIVGDDGPDTI